MASSAVFEWACELLERESGMTRIQARGTMRLVLSDAGLDVSTLTAGQLRVVASKLLAPALKARAILDPERISERMTIVPPDLEAAPASQRESPESIFKRLGRRKD